MTPLLEIFFTTLTFLFINPLIYFSYQSLQILSVLLLSVCAKYHLCSHLLIIHLLLALFFSTYFPCPLVVFSAILLFPKVLFSVIPVLHYHPVFVAATSHGSITYRNVIHLIILVVIEQVKINYQ